MHHNHKLKYLNIKRVYLSQEVKQTFHTNYYIVEYFEYLRTSNAVCVNASGASLTKTQNEYLNGHPTCRFRFQ